MRSKPFCSKFARIVNGNAKSLRELSVTNAIIRCVNSGLSFVAISFSNSTSVFTIVGMRFGEFIGRDSFYVKNRAGVEAVHVEILPEREFEIGVIGFPDHDL